MTGGFGRQAAVLVMAATVALAGLFACMSGAVVSAHMACCTAMQHDCHSNAAASDCCPVESQNHLALGAVKAARVLAAPLESPFEYPAVTFDLSSVLASLPSPGAPDVGFRSGPPPVYLLHAALLI